MKKENITFSELIKLIIKMDKDSKTKSESDKKKEEKQVRLEVFEEDDYFEEFEDGNVIF